MRQGSRRNWGLVCRVAAAQCAGWYAGGGVLGTRSRLGVQDDEQAQRALPALAHDGDTCARYVVMPSTKIYSAPAAPGARTHWPRHPWSKMHVSHAGMSGGRRGSAEISMIPKFYFLVLKSI